MVAVTVTLIAALTALWCVHRTLDTLAARWGVEQANAVRFADDDRRLRERELALREKSAEKPRLIPPMPPDLVARCTMWEDDFANEDERRTINNLYADFGDWDIVRSKLLPLNVLQQGQGAGEVMQ